MSSLLDVTRKGRVMVLTINNPQALNALGPEIYAAGKKALDEASWGDDVGAVVLTGAGEHFCAGGNLNRLKANRGKAPSHQRDSLDALAGFVRAIRDCPRPVIAAVEGAAAGAGFSLALGCDLLVAAENSKFVMAYVNIGLNPDGGGSWFLARSLPPQMAAEFMFEGGRVPAARLAAVGVINKITAKGEALQTALDWAERLAAGPPAALGRAKDLLNAAYGRVDEHLELEATHFVEALHHDEAGEGINAFLEKRKPDFLGKK